ncbi:MAG TPA: MarR family winged helix-turn-helix transcriptional regulator [Rhizomicrobium sp.]
MAEALDPAGTPPPQTPDPISAEELVKVVSAMNRFLSKFAAMKAFTDARLTVADWTRLMHLSEAKETTYGALAMFTGISGQRVVRMVETLVTAGLITSTPSTDPAVPNPLLSLSDAGKSRLSALNDALKPLLLKAFESTPKYLPNIKGGLLPLMRIIPS